MELKVYLRVLLKKWWIVLPVFLVTLTTTIVLTYTQPPTYSATATYIVTPNVTFEDSKSFMSSLDMLSRRTEIASTYAEVAVSRHIKKTAAEALNLTSTQRSSLSVSSQLRAGTNVLEITVEGSDNQLVSDFANQVGTQTVLYVSELYETFDMEPLDEASKPRSPIKPNKMMNMVLGAVGGLGLGIGVAFLAAYLQAPLETMTNFSILDSETGVYNQRYFSQRLVEEMSRANRNQYPLSVALMNVDQMDVLRTAISSQARQEVLRMVAAFLKHHLRQEDVIARMGKTTFGFLLPDMPEETAKTLMEKLQTGMTWTPFEAPQHDAKLNLSSAAGVTAYKYNGTRHDELIAQAGFALQQAESADYGKVLLFHEVSATKEGAQGG